MAEPFNKREHNKQYYQEHKKELNKKRAYQASVSRSKAWMQKFVDEKLDEQLTKVSTVYFSLDKTNKDEFYEETLMYLKYLIILKYNSVHPDVRKGMDEHGLGMDFMKSLD